MKKIIIFLISLFTLILNVNANSIDDINMNIFIDDNGDAKITETWKVNINDGTEGYKPYYNLGNSRIIDFNVTDENNKLYEFNSIWNTADSFNEKAYKNGINYLQNGLELCWGISKYGNRKYILNYTITNFVSNTTDGQMIYWTLIPYELSLAPKNVNIVIRSNKRFEDEIGVWGYGNYGGTAYVYDGRIEMNSAGVLNSDEYMTILVQLPSGMFNTTNNLDNDFDFYLDQAKEDSVSYVKEENNEIFLKMIFYFLMFFFPIVVFIAAYIFKNKKDNNFKKNISKGKFDKDTPYYRDIPCNKDIKYAYFIASNYNLIKTETDFLGAMILNWFQKGYLTIEKREIKKIFKTKEETCLILHEESALLDGLELKMFNYMKVASKDGVLEPREFENYSQTNYTKIIKWFDDIKEEQKKQCIENGLLEKTEKILSLPIETVDIYEEAKKMYGLKKFLLDFSSIEDKSSIEVKLWDYYLMYAQIFGIADRVAKEFEKLYPEGFKELGYDYSDFVFIHAFSDNSMRVAMTAKERAASYSSGGGGFSSGGGGGGSFGGGGGGGGFR